ncbi:DUF1877 family protein [Streptomyces sp. MBT53]|uniref:DUF1877 family protein n=1 Tax=Streptomyces sp. MBT53 TaxID=1488384 RepID=UPI0027DA2E11|nr:DUF1877 family protein [Streptomyces sp. MBT53]
MHRSLADGYLGYDNGICPLNAVILGGVQLHEGDDHIVGLLTPDRVRDVAGAMADVGREALKAGWDCIDIEDYGPNFGHGDFVCTWANVTDLVVFFRRAADAGSHVIFTVGR